MNATRIPALAFKACFVVALAMAANACVVVDAKSVGQDVVVCHKGKKTMTLPREALDAHLGHGDHRGPC